MRRAFPYVVLVIAVGVLFSVGITDGHLSGDDVLYTCGCPFVKDGVSAKNILMALTSVGYGAIWMPFTFFTYMLDVSLWGGGWVVHHSVNVFLHALNACLAYFLVRALIRRSCPTTSPAVDVGCLLAVLMWAVHPMRVDAVTWVASRKDMLWTGFALMGLLAWIRHLETGAWRWTCATFVCFVLACLSKPTAVCFPLLAVVVGCFVRCDRIFRERALVPMLLVSLAVGALFVVAQTNPTDGPLSDASNCGLDWRILNASVSLGLSVWRFVCPIGVHHEYRAVFGGWPVDGGLGLFVLAAAILAVVIVVLRTRSQSVRSLLVLSVLWFLVGIGLTLGILRHVNGDQAFADRYAYLPSLAFSFLIARGLVAALGVGRFRAVGVVLALAALGFEVVLSVPVIRSLHDDYQAYSRTLACDPDHWRALRVVGNEYCARQNRTEEGIALLRRSLRLRGSQRTADSLAYVLAYRGAPGDFAEVRRLGRAAVANPACDVGGMMLEALGVVSLRTGDPAQAVRYFTASLKAPKREYDVRYTRQNLSRAQQALREKNGRQ